MTITPYPANNPLADGIFSHSEGDDMLAATADWYRSLAECADADALKAQQAIIDAQSRLFDIRDRAHRCRMLANRLDRA